MSDSANIDVVVAGAGAAGLSAALAAAESGCSVVVIESESRFVQCCNTALSTSMIPASGSRWQRAAGIDDAPDRFLADIRRKTHNTADAIVARALTTVAPELVEWLADRCGVALELVTDFDYPGHSCYRCHAVANRSGQTLHQELLAAVQTRPNIDLVVPCELTDVLSNSNGAVVGVISRTPDGHTEQVLCTAVVLATNGFGSNRDMVQRYLPSISSARYFGGPGSRGTALKIGNRLGADVACLDSYQGHGSVTVPQSTLLTWAAVMHGGIIVNMQGLRFGDETAGYSEYAEAVLCQPGGAAWVIFDKRIDQLCRVFTDYGRCLESGAIRWATNPAMLADLTGIPVEALAATLTAVGAAGAADPFGRTRWEERLYPPFAFARVTGALFHTQGGLRVDGEARVLRNGSPIAGLYAAGGAAVGVSGHGAAGYLAGNGLLAALGLGYLAGRACGTRYAARSPPRNRGCVCNSSDPM